MSNQINKWPYKNIPVSPDVYEKVKRIAQDNGRTLGGQVMMWVGECSHPTKQRRLVGRTIVGYPPSDLIAPVKIWQCGECGRLLVLPVDGFDGDTRSLVSAETEK